jgi:hypothetical protein
MPTLQCTLSTIKYYLQHATPTKSGHVVPPEDGQVMPETCQGFEF